MLSPSLLSADLADIARAIRRIESGGGSAVHIDVMDGHFVPPISYGQPVIRAARAATRLPFDVHLMAERPDDMAASFAEAGADWITFHVEAARDPESLVRAIHGMGKKAGVSIVPATPVSAIDGLLPLVDIALVMTVEPGFGGQRMIPSCVEKIALLARTREERGLGYLVSVDGGVNATTLQSVISAGADIVVSGSAFFKGELGWNAI